MVKHTKPELRAMVKFFTKHGAREVAIERGDGPVVAAVPHAGITVVVISPNRVKHFRFWYCSAGNKDDRFDAFVPADTLPTNRLRCVHWPRTGQPRLRCEPPRAPATLP